MKDWYGRGYTIASFRRLVMGATSWRYFTDWRGDVGAALKELQGEVFRTGKYECQYGGDPHDWIEGLDVLFAQAGMPPKSPPIRSAGWTPVTIDELLAHVGQEGTHSILDVFGVATKEEFGKAYPAPDAWLHQAYGTTRPTRRMVEENGFPPEVLEWRFVYFAVWDGDGSEGQGEPRWWYFEGSSGD